jgi:hypothetical protein
MATKTRALGGLVSDSGPLSDGLLSAQDIGALPLTGGTLTGTVSFAGAQTFPGTQAALVSGTNIKTVNGNSVLGSGDIVIAGGVTSFNTRTGDITLGSSDVTTALGFTPGTGNVTLDGTQTLTNKTLTSPVINGMTGNTAVINIGSGQFYKDASGNVGIGTSSPAARLDVRGGDAVLGTSRFTIGAIELGELGTGDRPTFVDFHGAGLPGTLDFSARIIRQAGSNGDFDIFNTGTGAVTFAANGSERARIDASGNVGIGTSSPGAKLDVNGSVNATTGTFSGLIKADSGTIQVGPSAGVYRQFRYDGTISADGTNFFPLVNSSNVGTYALPIAGGSMTGLLIGRESVGTNVNTMNDAGSFSVRSNNANAASISFHRTGAYAINMGVGTDNVFVIGGWSASANAFRMDGSGNLTMLANVTAFSDERVKTNWRDLRPDFIERLAEVKHGIYDRTDQASTQVGVSAQSLQKILEHAVMESEEGQLSVAYGNAALVAAVKLAERVVALEARLAAIEAKR